MIPRFFTNSLTTGEFKWLHQEAWSDEHLAYFTAHQPSPPTGLARQAPYETGRKRPPALLGGRWVLEFDQDRPVAWAEVWTIERKFGIVHLNLSPCSAPEGWMGAPLAALSLLISGLFLMSGADLIRLCQTDASRLPDELVSWGTMADVWTPYTDSYLLVHDLAEAGCSTQVLAIDPHEWWTLASGEKDKATLGYLERRIGMQREAEEPPQPRRRRRGLIERLFRWT